MVSWHMVQRAAFYHTPYIASFYRYLLLSFWFSSRLFSVRAATCDHHMPLPLLASTTTMATYIIRGAGFMRFFLACVTFYTFSPQDYSAYTTTPCLLHWPVLYTMPSRFTYSPLNFMPLCLNASYTRLHYAPFPSIQLYRYATPYAFLPYFPFIACCALPLPVTVLLPTILLCGSYLFLAVLQTYLGSIHSTLAFCSTTCIHYSNSCVPFIPIGSSHCLCVNLLPLCYLCLGFTTTAHHTTSSPILSLASFHVCHTQLP